MDITYQKICERYLADVCGLISLYETLETKFPMGILNEIRNIFTHLSKATVSKDSNEKEKELKNANEHLKRAIRDGYKYNCLAYEKIYLKFKKEKLYKHKSNHELLIQIEVSHSSAIDKVLVARSNETKVKAEIVGDEFEYYEQAFAEYKNMRELIITLYKS